MGSESQGGRKRSTQVILMSIRNEICSKHVLKTVWKDSLMSPQIFLVRNAVVSYLIAFKSTDIYFVTLLYILQSICAGEFRGYSNYSKPYGHGKQLINGLQFLSRLKNHLCLAWEKSGALSQPSLVLFLTEVAALYVDTSRLACWNEVPSLQAGALIRLISFHPRLSVLPSASLMVWVCISALSNMQYLQARPPSENNKRE